MAKDRTLSKKAKETIYRIMDERGEMTRDEVKEIIEPHFIYDAEYEKDLALSRKANQIMARPKDDAGVRKYFNCHLNGESLYIDIEKTDNVEALLVMEEQNNKVISARSKANQKMRNRRWEIEGQLSLDLEGLAKDGA